MRAGPLFIALTMVALARPALAAPRAENAALDALSKAEGDFLAMNYASGAARLDKALRACAPSNCSPSTQAALLRDIGTMEFRAGDKGFATKAFSEALRLQPNIDLNPSYDSQDLRAAWMEIKGGGAAPLAPVQPAVPAGPAAPNAPAVPPPPTLPQPTGDFVHAPAAEQKIDTPLPVFVEGGPNGVAHVIVRFKSPEEGDEAEWNHTDLARMGAGWGGLIPCNAVTGGTFRYYIQGYNRDMDPVATNGDAKNPYQVTIREELFGPPARLPNRPPPRACHQAKKSKGEAPAPEEKETSPTDCPPGMPGCGKPEKAEEENEEEEVDETKGGAKKKKKKDFARWWIGAGLHVDFMQIPSGSDLCRLQPGPPNPGPNPGLPANDKHFYCTNSSGADFPTHNAIANDQLSRGTAGQSGGGIALGNLRLTLSVDYAVTGNLLLGVRGGYVLFTYPGAAGVLQGYASGQKYYVEGRITGVIGKDPLAKAGFAPILFVGGGVSPFDAHTSDTAQVCVNAAANPACNGMGAMMYGPPGLKQTAHATVPVDIWITNGLGFVDVGGGIRYAPVPRVGVIVAARVNVSFGSNGVIPTLGPEAALQVGF